MSRVLARAWIAPDAFGTFILMQVEARDGPKVFIDTQIATLFRFRDSPDAFVPEGLARCIFEVTMPVVIELERIKDEHFSAGQQGRARWLLDKLEESDRSGPLRLTAKSFLHFCWPEPPGRAVELAQMNVDHPDSRLVAAIYWATTHSNLPFYVLSDDVGVRVRAKHMLGPNCTVVKPPDIRYTPESFNLPQLVKAAVKDLAVQLAAEMRGTGTVSEPGV